MTTLNLKLFLLWEFGSTIFSMSDNARVTINELSSALECNVEDCKVPLVYSSKLLTVLDSPFVSAFLQADLRPQYQECLNVGIISQ